MVTILGMWEPTWMSAERTERRLWKQTVQAFAVDTWAMSPAQGGEFTSPVQYADLAAMLAAHPGPKTFLIPEDTATTAGLSFVDLPDYAHPTNAIYVFGSGTVNMVDHVTEADDVVCICTPGSTHMFAPGVVVAVLVDRCSKLG